MCCHTFEFSEKTYEVQNMTKNNENIAKIDIKGFYDLCNRLKELEEENEQLKANNQLMADELTYFKEYCADLEDKVNRNERMIRGLKINNSSVTLERNNLLSEIEAIKRMPMFEFAAKYCNNDELEEAGHALARSLLGKPMTPEEVAISEAESRYDYYQGDDF